MIQIELDLLNIVNTNGDNDWEKLKKNANPLLRLVLYEAFALRGGGGDFL